MSFYLVVGEFFEYSTCHFLLLIAIAYFLIGTISIPHLGQCPGVSLITSGCMAQAYFTALVILDVSLIDAAAESFLFSEELPLLQDVNIEAAASINAMIVFFILLIFYRDECYSLKLE